MEANQNDDYGTLIKKMGLENLITLIKKNKRRVKAIAQATA